MSDSGKENACREFITGVTGFLDNTLEYLSRIDTLIARMILSITFTLG